MRAAFLLPILLTATLVHAATPEQLQAAKAALERVNLYRAIHGVAPVPLDEALTDACIAHANYLDLNPASISDPYTEDLGLPGATAVGAVVAPECILSYDTVGAAGIDRLYNSYSTRVFLLAPDFVKAGYGETAGANGGRPIAVLRTGDIHSPTKLLSPPDGAKGVDTAANIVLFGAQESSNIQVLSSSVSANGVTLEHSASATTTSGSRPNLLKDVLITPGSLLPAGTLITVTLDYSENGATKQAVWSFTTSAAGTFDPVEAGASMPGSGASDTSDADGDGFPANVEKAAGTSPDDPNSTPFSGQSAGTAQPLDASKLSIKLNFAKPDKDSIQFGGALAVPPAFVALGTAVIVDVSGVSHSFSLNDKGAGTNELKTRTFKLSKPKNGFAKYKVKFAKGNFAADLSDEGLANANIKGDAVSVPVAIYFNRTLLTKDVAQTYKAKFGKSGSSR